MILLGPVLTVLVCAFALWRGGAPERFAAGIALIVLAGSLVAQVLVGRTSAWPIVGADLCLGIAFIALSFIHARTWLYVAIGLCAALLLVHSFLLEEGAVITPLYRTLVDGLDLALLVTLVVATLANGRTRRPDTAPASRGIVP